MKAKTVTTYLDCLLGRLEDAHHAGQDAIADFVRREHDQLMQLFWLIEYRDQLLALFAPASASDDLVRRIEQLLTFGERVDPATDDQLRRWVRSHLQQTESLAARLDLKATDLQLIDRIAKFPIDVLDGELNVAERNGIELGGIELGGPDRNVDDDMSEVARFADLEKELARSDQPGVARRWPLSIIQEATVTGGYSYIGAHVASAMPGASGAFDYGPYFEIWKAGATLWLLPDRVVALRNTAHRWNIAHYTDERPALPPDLVASDWLSTNPAGRRPIIEAIASARRNNASTVHITGCELASLPIEIAALKLLTNLVIDGCADLGWPEIVNELHLETLSLVRCGIKSIPRSALPTLTALKRLDLSHNELTGLPPELGRNQSLERLNIAGNPINELPDEILSLAPDTAIILHSTNLPQHLASCRTIAQLREASADNH